MNKTSTPRCFDHRDLSFFPVNPPTCRVCARIAVEADIVTRVVDALLAAGYSLTVDDEGTWRPAMLTTNRDEILAELMETDEDYLRVEEGLRRGWVRFVYGNDGWDVVCDYTTSLESVLAPVNAYADSLAN